MVANFISNQLCTKHQFIILYLNQKQPPSQSNHPHQNKKHGQGSTVLQIHTYHGFKPGRPQPIIMQEETNENTPSQKKETNHISRDTYKRSRQVNEKEAEDYLKRPVNKINDPNRSLKRAYGKKHLEDPKFSYIHTLKQLRKKGEDSVSQHGDTDDEDFDLNELSKSVRKKKETKRKEKAKVRNIKQSRKVSKQISQIQIQKRSIDQESEIIAEQALEEKDVHQAQNSNKDGQIKDQIEGNNKTHLQNSSNTQQELLDKQNQKEEEKSESKESIKSQSSQQQSEDNESDSKEQKPTKTKQTKQQNQKDSNNNQIKQQSDSEDKMDQENHSQSLEKQQQNEKQDLADRIKNVLNNQQQSQEEVKLTTFKKFDKKGAKRRKMISKQKPTIKSKSKVLLKKEVFQQSKSRSVSKSKSLKKRKGKNLKISGKAQAKQQKKVSPHKNKKEEGTPQTLRTRNVQPRTIVEEIKEQQAIRRSSRKRLNKSMKETQLNLKGEIADMSNPPPFIEEKIKPKQELAFVDQPLIFDSSQQKIDKFMVKVHENPNQTLNKINRQQGQHNACFTNGSAQNSRIESATKESQKTITHFLQQRRKSLKISNKVVVQSIFCYERKSQSRNHKSKKHKYRTVIEQNSSDEDTEQYVVARRKHKYNDVPKMKKYRKIVIDDAVSEEEYCYVVGKKHKKDKRKYEDEQQYPSGKESKHKKRKYKQTVDSSESKSVQIKQVDG